MNKQLIWQLFNLKSFTFNSLKTLGKQARIDVFRIPEKVVGGCAAGGAGWRDKESGVGRREMTTKVGLGRLEPFCKPFWRTWLCYLLFPFLPPHRKKHCFKRCILWRPGTIENEHFWKDAFSHHSEPLEKWHFWKCSFPMSRHRKRSLFEKRQFRKIEGIVYQVQPYLISAWSSRKDSGTISN